MFGMQNKTPDERKAIAAKGRETAKRNREEKAKKRADAEAKVLGLKNEIETLKKERDAIAREIKASDISASLTGYSLLSEENIVSKAKPLDSYCGVYFLVKKNKVVYVGQSVNVFSRVAKHAMEKDFDAMAWIPCKKTMLDKLESLYIHVLQPTLNGNGGLGGTKTAPLKLKDLLTVGKD